MNNVFSNSTIANMDLKAITAHIHSSQVNLAKTADTYRQRSRKEHAALMLEARTIIKQMRNNVSIDKQAEMMTRHQIRTGGAGVSDYTPWIKLLFGKLDSGKLVKFGGQENAKWTPDSSYARYFNFYEVIDRDFAGSEDELLDWVIEAGGPAKMVEDELTRKREANAPSAETKEERRNLYLAEMSMPSVSLPADAIKDGKEFVAVVLQKHGDGYRLVGVSKTDASADLDRLAETSFDALTKAKAGREAAEKQERQREEDRQRARDEYTQQVADALGIKAGDVIARVKAQQADAAKASADQQDAG